MKISINNIFFALGATALMTSCGENSWNDHLDGFEPGVNYNKPISAEFTMTGTDYSAIASNKSIQAVAEAAGASSALKAVGSNACFSTQIPAKEYLPLFLASSSSPYFLAPDGSKVNVTFDEVGLTEPIISKVAAATRYTVTKDDYVNAWGSDKDFISAFAPMASAETKLPGLLKGAFPDASEGELAIVNYNQSATNPIFISDSETEGFVGGTFFMVADAVCAAGPLAATKGYGYLPLIDVSVVAGNVATSEANAFTFIPTDGGFFIKDVYGRFLYQSGTYNSFNVSASLPESGAVWTVEMASNGQATITNTAVGKWIQFDGNYSSWGSYADAKGSLPVLFKAPDPKFYLVTDEGRGAGPLADNKTYGYLASVDMTVENGIVTNADAANAFTFELTKGGYYIKDSYGRFLYQTGTYNSFNVSPDEPESGAIWSMTVDASGAVTLTNSETAKWIQYDSNYSSWGSYAEAKGSLPMLYNAAAEAEAPTATPAKVVAGTPVTAAITAVYEFDGSKWAKAEGVIALDAEDYEAMGFDNGKLENAEVYLPLFLKHNQPYAVEGDQMAVVYNGSACSVLIYDGSNWTINDNDFQTKTAMFSKDGDDWKFVKYVGKSYFNLTEELILDRSYLIVLDGTCAIPPAESYTYGYLKTTPVNIVNNVIEMPNEANAFTFASSAVIDDVTYTLPEGQFFMIDSYGRYMLIKGTYQSFNLEKAPTVTDGKVDPSFIFRAEHQGSGVWKIINAYNDSWMQLDASYGSYGSYTTEKGSMPTLYVISE